MNAEKVYFYHGWKCRRVEGIVKGFIPALWSEGKAVILITKSDASACQVGRYFVTEIDGLTKMENAVIL